MVPLVHMAKQILISMQCDDCFFYRQVLELTLEAKFIAKKYEKCQKCKSKNVPLILAYINNTKK